ncbi:hypothetical protein BC833DRAFT_593599 [Globomyces pollinis-pini]|nr:hypothetical protein BC833DRAFT_593599 [Globomyces pollinis-pini]
MILKTVTSKFPAQSLSDIWNLVHHTLSQFNQGNRQFLEDNFDFILNWGKSVMDDNIFIISSIINFIVQNDYKIDHLNTILPFSPEHLFNVQLIHWNQFTDVQFLHLLYWSIHHNLLAIENDFVAFDLFEIILRNDLHQCLKFLLSNGLEIYDEWCLYLATSANSIQCVEMLLSIGINPHTNDDICIFDAAKYGHPRILLNFFKYWENDPILIKKILYTAIEYDQVSVIKLLFNSSSIPVKVDKYALWLAIQPRENPARDSDTNLTILQILLQHNDETKKYVIICNDKDEEVVKNYKRQRIC